MKAVGRGGRAVNKMLHPGIHAGMEKVSRSVDIDILHEPPVVEGWKDKGGMDGPVDIPCRQGGIHVVPYIMFDELELRRGDAGYMYIYPRDGFHLIHFVKQRYQF